MTFTSALVGQAVEQLNYWLHAGATVYLADALKTEIHIVLHNTRNPGDDHPRVAAACAIGANKRSRWDAL